MPSLVPVPPPAGHRVGLTGISWGGYLTCIAAGVDARFRFAVPVYGCGFTCDTVFYPSVAKAGAEKGARWMDGWDPARYLAKVAVPMLWLNSLTDFAYWLPAWQQSYRLVSPEGRIHAMPKFGLNPRACLLCSGAVGVRKRWELEGESEGNRKGFEGHSKEWSFSRRQGAE